MLSKNEIIEKMAMALDDMEMDSTGWQNRTETWKGVCRNRAEVVLQALLESLPKTDHTEHDEFHSDNGSYLYQEFLAMRDR